MRKFEDLKIGCTAGGTTHQDTNIPAPAEKVRMVAEAGVFDYIDRTPPLEEIEEYAKASQKYGLPILSCGWFYTLGRDEKLYLLARDEIASIVTKPALMPTAKFGVTL